ncbi:hypothetical protein [Candidatus Magnetominusculus dajiuhuensis]|uniref:hypothetical protein n=1 Tax=Candidatus Magnetominusculus dajiuhuensis TaxID=3137712 RepID=UPI003B43D2FE
MKNKRLDELFREVRNSRPDTSGLERNFETRLARRFHAKKENQWNIYEWSWKLMPYFIALIILLSTLGFGVTSHKQKDYYYTYTTGLEQTVLMAYMKDNR